MDRLTTIRATRARGAALLLRVLGARRLRRPDGRARPGRRVLHAAKTAPYLRDCDLVARCLDPQPWKTCLKACHEVAHAIIRLVRAIPGVHDKTIISGAVVNIECTSGSNC